MMETLWSFIDEAKKNKPYMTSKTQFNNMVKLLKTKNREEIRKEWNEAYRQIRAKDFDKLHISNGGIVNEGDDGFYMDFGNWVVAQGKELFDAIQKDGHTAVLQYIKQHRVPKREYTFECMVYALSETYA